MGKTLGSAPGPSTRTEMNRVPCCFGEGPGAALPPATHVSELTVWAGALSVSSNHAIEPFQK